MPELLPFQDLNQHGIVIVDDDESILAVTSIVLKMLNFSNCYFFSTASGVLETHQRDSSIGLIISDYLFPGSNGKKLLEKVRVINPNTRRVMSSGMPPPGINSLIDNDLLHDYLAKPYEHWDLTELIQKQLSVYHNSLK
jgi:DNA-binding NtrC family response regulator